MLLPLSIIVSCESRDTSGMKSAPKRERLVAWQCGGECSEERSGAGLLGALHDKLRIVPRIADFRSFVRRKERQHQGAPIFDTRSARSGALVSACSPLGESYACIDDNEEDHPLGESRPQSFSRCSNEQFTVSTTASSSGSRPGTRQGSRPGDAQRELNLAKQEVGEDTFFNIAMHEVGKQEYWDDYTEADLPKKITSDFEELQRSLISGLEDEDITDSDMQSATAGLTQRTPRERLISAYARQCHKTYSIPLGPRRLVHVCQDHVTAAQLTTPELLNYGGWSLGSERLDALCEAQGTGLQDCRHCNLSGNRILDRSVPLICNKLLPTIVTLDLSQNALSRTGARHLAQGFLALAAKAPLIELNLEGNSLGGGVGEKDVCYLIETLETSCRQLQALSLAQNQLGKVDAGLGRSLGRMAAALLNLRVLDLHWNFLHGLGAYGLLSGIYENGQHGGKLSRLDLSWNGLGKVDESHQNATPAKVLADVLEDHPLLFHLDISYNMLCAEDCAHLARGLRGNHTLFGFHIAGNAATLDASGFLVPCWTHAQESRTGSAVASVAHATMADAQPSSASPKAPLADQHLMSYEVPSGHQHDRNSKARGSMKKAVKATRQSIKSKRKGPLKPHEVAHHAVDLFASLGNHPLEQIALRAEKCWVCDRWEEVLLTWTPGVSGTTSDNEIERVVAFLSIDNFARATPLERKVTECRGETLVRWECYRMLPPATDATEPLLVVFQVNDQLEFARDMPSRVVSPPISLSLHAPATPAAQRDAGAMLTGTGADRGEPCAASTTGTHGFAEVPIGVGTPVVEVVADATHANEVLVTSSARKLVAEHGIGMPLVITENAIEHGKIMVLPRRVAGSCQKVARKWSKASSVWAQWREVDDNFYDKMISHDLRLSKVTKFIKEDGSIKHLKAAILPHYPLLVSIYRKMSVTGSVHTVFGVGPNTAVSLGVRCDIYDGALSTKHVGNFAILASAIDRRLAGEVRVRNDNLLIRYQFLETWLRAADAKYVQTRRVSSLSEAASKLFGEFDELGGTWLMEETEFLSTYFVAEIDMVYKARLNLLHAIYDIYASEDHSSSGVQTITVATWCALLNDCDAFDDRFVRRKASYAFMMGMMLQVDEVSSERHMQMSFVEFLVALGAVVYMRQFFYVEEFADLIEEFFEDSLKPLLDRKGSDEQRSLGTQPAVQVGDTRRTFAEAFKQSDEDGDGVLTLREFRTMLRHPRVMALFGGRSFKMQEFMKVFETLDGDNNHMLTLDEALAGFASIQRLEATAERCSVFLHHILQNADLDDDNMLSRAEFFSVLNRSATQRKLMRLSVDPSHVFAFHNSLDAESLRLFSVDELVDGIMALRTPQPVAKWKIVLRQIFAEGDSDMNGALSKAEFKSILVSQSAVGKLERIGVKASLLEGLFDVLDQDGSNEITEHELLDGFQQLCSRFGLKSLAAEKRRTQKTQIE